MKTEIKKENDKKQPVKRKYGKETQDRLIPLKKPVHQSVKSNNQSKPYVRITRRHSIYSHHYR